MPPPTSSDPAPTGVGGLNSLCPASTRSGRRPAGSRGAKGRLQRWVSRRNAGTGRAPTWSEWVEVDGRPMHARVSGARDATGPVVVLVHGLGMSSRYMKPLLRALGSDVRALAVDLPGYGRSPTPGVVPGLAGLADALSEWMLAHGLDRAVVVGNSLGAQVIAHLAVRHPERIERAVLIGSTRDPDAGGMWQHAGRLFLDAFRERPSLTLVGAIDYMRAGPIAMARLFAAALRSREEQQLRHLVVPTLIVRGSRDLVSTQAWNEKLAALIPDSRLVVIPGVAHAVNYSAAQPLARVVRDFLRTTSAQPVNDGNDAR